MRAEHGGRRAAGRGVRARRLRPAGPGGRGDVPARDQLPGRGPAPGLRGVLPQLLRRPGRDVGRRAGRHVPHLLPGLQRGPGVRRARRRVRRGAVGPAAATTWPPATSRCAPAPTSPGSSPAGRRRYRVHTPGGPLDADAVVLATDVGGLRAIVARSPGLDDPAWREQVGGLRTARRSWSSGSGWTGRSTRTGPAFLATGGLDPLDNISVLDRYEGQARAWAAAHGGSVVELHAYAAAGDPPPRPTPRCSGDHGPAARAVPGDRRGPRAGRVGAVARRLPDVRASVTSPRAGVRTPFPGLVLAGDGIRIDLPVALMERAASTGWHAANCLLARWGLAGHQLYTVPTRGRMAGLRWLATHARARSDAQAATPAPAPARQLAGPGPPQGPEPRQPDGQPVQPPQPHQFDRPSQGPEPDQPLQQAQRPQTEQPHQRRPSSTSNRTGRRSHTSLPPHSRGCIDELTGPSRPRGPPTHPLAGPLAAPADSPWPVGPPAADLRRGQTSSDRCRGQAGRGAPVR